MIEGQKQPESAPSGKARVWSRTVDQCSRDKRLRPERSAQAEPLISGATDIPRKPNYEFERRERERTKAAESAKKALAKAEKRASEQGTPALEQSGEA